ncbi:hypothetical protein EXIGLDRAFT_129338 [Exidia glandulosa HHB12029]|uniref:Granulins domain-containing protein n=1 Tax=Exidia glandulosa HHB12029 TaxID=1314781 RepID=A0A165G6Z4_EXIGL|nr:hypothetical protein EXIGLDRAFT_129338 [Exidia glandulosa HHB12029]
MGRFFTAMFVILQVVPHGCSFVNPAERSFTPLTPLASTDESSSTFQLIAREGVCASGLHCEQGCCPSESYVCCWGLSGCCPSATTCTVDGCCPIDLSKYFDKCCDGRPCYFSSGYSQRHRNLIDSA